MVRSPPERVLLIGDVRQDLQPAVLAALPGAQVVAVASVFDAVAELSARPYTTVLVAAEPIERRPESAVRTLRELTGTGRLLLFGHPTLEPLSRKMLTFGVDDYLITPTSAAELQEMLAAAPVRVADAPDDLPRRPVPPATAPPLPAGLPLAEVVLDALLSAPQDAAAVAAARVNEHLGPDATLAYTAGGAAAPVAGPAAIVHTHAVRVGTDDLGAVHLTVPAHADEAHARHLLAHLAHLFGKVAALQDRHNRLQKLAITDELTGLYNGRYFRHYLARIVDRARTHMFPVTLLLFDIDNFKKYNDQFGHGVGDEILRQTAALMRRCVRDHDLVARISGDEFAVVFWEKDGPRKPHDAATPAGPAGRPPQTPVQILERFRRLLASETFTGLGPGGQGTLTISGGLAVYPWHAQSVADLIAAARPSANVQRQEERQEQHLLGRRHAGRRGDRG